MYDSETFRTTTEKNQATGRAWLGEKDEGQGEVISQNAGEVNRDQVITVSLIRNLNINLENGSHQGFKLVTNIIQFTFQKDGFGWLPCQEQIGGGGERRWEREN